jgi:hypothetical protein
MKAAGRAVLLALIAIFSGATFVLSAPESSLSEHNTSTSGKDLEVIFIDPDAATGGEEDKVLHNLKALYEAYLRGDWDTFEKYLDPACTKYDGGTNERYSGSKAIIERLRKELDDYKKSDSPLLSYTVDHPYARVKGDMATVTFVAVRVYGGKHPAKYESHCSDIFLKEDGMWKKVYYRSDWKLVK